MLHGRLLIRARPSNHRHHKRAHVYPNVRQSTFFACGHA
jgi:hypothetical protein